MPNFNGQLSVNEVFGSIYNMIISQIVFADNIYDTKSTLSDLSRVDGGLYGDTKLFYATNVAKSFDWTGDLEAQNLLKLHRPEPPKCQAIKINNFRMIPTTVDNYLSKRAFADEYAFAMFNAQILSWLRDTKRVYDSTLFNSFIGTHAAGLKDNGKGSRQNVNVSIPAGPDGVDDYNTESYNRIVAQTVAKKIADLIVDLEDVSRDFNDYGNLRSYSADSLRFVWNSEWVNTITKLDVPTIFNNKNLIDKFAEHTLPARYFGNVNTSSGTTSGNNTTIRSLIEKDYNTVEPNQPGYDSAKHIFPGDLLPDNTAYDEGTTYTEDHTIVLKIYHKDSVPFMSAFETGTSFFNPRALTETHYLIWGYNDLEHLKNYPFITVKAVQAAV